MTRQEEIDIAWFIKAVQSNHRYDEKSFRSAVDWADSTLKEKMYDWINEHFYEVPFTQIGPNGADVLESRIETEFYTKNEMIESLNRWLDNNYE